MATSRTAGTRLAGRLAAREVRRRPWRSLLVVALVAIPVAGMTVATTLIRTEDRNAIEAWDDRWGSADAVASLGGPYAFTSPEEGDGDDRNPAQQAIAADLTAALPAGTATLLQIDQGLLVRSEVHRAMLQFVATDLSDPMLGNRYDLRDGRLPSGAGEVAVNRATASKFRLAVGGPFTLARPEITFDVVGIVDDRECVRCEQVHVALDAVPTELLRYADARMLIDLPGTVDAQRLLHLQDEIAANDPEVINSLGYLELRPLDGVFTNDGDPGNAVRWSFVVGALVLAVVGIIIAAAFSVGARRQLVLLGQLSANGASESVLRRTLFLQGTVAGLIGSIAGVGLALVGLRVGHGVVETFLDRRFVGYDTGLVDVLVIVAIGTAGATLAALVPARTAARIQTLHALAGRRPLSKVPRALTGGGTLAALCGLGLLAVSAVGARTGTDGTMWAIIAILGGLGVLFGATATTPAIVERIEPLAGRARGTLRLAARSLGRNRTRTGAVIAAVAAAGALAVGGSTAARAATDDNSYTRLADNVAVVQQYVPSDFGETQTVSDEVEDRVAAAAPDARLVRPDLLGIPVTVDYAQADVDQLHRFESDRVLVVDDDLAAGMRLSGAARAALREDGIVIVDYDDGPAIDVTVTLGDAAPIEAPRRFSQYSLDQLASGIYVSPAFAAQLDADPLPSPLVAVNPTSFDEVELFDLGEMYMIGAVPGADVFDSIQLDIGYPDVRLDTRRLELLLGAVSVLFALIVVAIGLSLAAADEKDEREVLTVAGAGPGVLARVSGAKGWVLATLGALLAVPVGYLPAATVIATAAGERHLEFPTSVVVTLVIVAPLIAAVMAFAVASVARRVRPVRISTATFE